MCEAYFTVLVTIPQEEALDGINLVFVQLFSVYYIQYLNSL